MARTAISLTPAAADRVRELLASKGEGALGLKLGSSRPAARLQLPARLRARDQPGAEVVDVDGIKVVIEPRAVMHVLGTELDFVADKLGAQFVFKNPNEKARCGCGESFSVVGRAAAPRLAGRYLHPARRQRAHLRGPGGLPCSTWRGCVMSPSRAPAAALDGLRHPSSWTRPTSTAA